MNPIDKQNQVGEHKFRPLTWRDRLRSSGRCEACFLPKVMHPIHFYVPARPLGDKRPAEASWEALGGE